jgi:glycosyltransferase involved in cell wall biosynthesis
VLALVGDENGCSLWRTYLPFAELCRQGHIAEWAPLDRSPEVFPLVAAGLFDAVILPRLAWHAEHQVEARRWVRSLHNAGLTVIYEVDDDVFSPQIGARQQATTEPDKSLEQLEQDRRDRISAMRLCDAVTVSNDTLARVVRQYVANEVPVLTVPNRIDHRWWRRVLHGVRRVVPSLTIGWAGGARYQEDFFPLVEAWHNIAARYPEVTFVVQGFMPDQLIGAVPAERVRRLPWLPLEEYPRALLNVDIGCASVANNHFNRCKTPIKLWEYTMGGAVSVVSPTLYGEVAHDGEDCLVADTAAEWEAALSRLIDDQQLRRRLWRAQRRVVAERYSLEKHAHLWLEAWSQIIQHARRPRLLLAS